MTSCNRGIFPSHAIDTLINSAKSSFRCSFVFAPPTDRNFCLRSAPLVAEAFLKKVQQFKEGTVSTLASPRVQYVYYATVFALLVHAAKAYDNDIQLPPAAPEAPEVEIQTLLHNFRTIWTVLQPYFKARYGFILIQRGRWNDTSEQDFRAAATEASGKVGSGGYSFLQRGNFAHIMHLSRRVALVEYEGAVEKGSQIPIICEFLTPGPGNEQFTQVIDPKYGVEVYPFCNTGNLTPEEPMGLHGTPPFSSSSSDSSGWHLMLAGGLCLVVGAGLGRLGMGFFRSRPKHQPRRIELRETTV